MEQLCFLCSQTQSLHPHCLEMSSDLSHSSFRPRHCELTWSSQSCLKIRHQLINNDKIAYHHLQSNLCNHGNGNDVFFDGTLSTCIVSCPHMFVQEIEAGSKNDDLSYEPRHDRHSNWPFHQSYQISVALGCCGQKNFVSSDFDCSPLSTLV